MDILALMAALSVLATVVALLYAFYAMISEPSSAAVRGRLQGLMSGTSVIESGGVPGALRKTGPDTSFLHGLISTGLTERLDQQLERADLTIRPAEYVALRFALAAVGAVAPILFFDGIISYLLAGAGLIVGYNLPKIYLNKRRKGRVAKLNAQLPEALVMISNSMKAGFGLVQALNAAAEQLAHPISTEMARTIHEMNIGSSAEEALLGLSERAGSYDLDIVVTAILVQRTVGGNLGEILDTVAGTMRERIRIRGEIETLTAQQKLTGIVIGLLPVGVGIMFQFMSDGYIDPLFNTVVGNVMISVAIVLEVVGILIIQRILNIEV